MKRFVFLGLLTILTLALVACGGTGGGGDAGQAEELTCEDELGCITVAPGGPIRVASALVITGPNTQLGLDSQRGVEIAIADRGEIHGHPIELQAEDDGCSAEGGQTAAQKIVSDPQIVGVIGTSCSGAGVPASQIVADAGYLMISPSNTAPVLTAPETRNEGYFRTAHNDTIQGRAMAEFAYNELGVRVAAAVHDGDPYTEGLASVFNDSFKELGGTMVAFQAEDPEATDVTPLLTSIASAEPAPEFLYYPVFTVLGANLTQQAKQVPGLENTHLAAADGVLSPDFLAASGEAALGMYLSGPDLSFENAAYEEFLQKYQDEYGDPVSVYHAHAYDATNMLLDAVEQVAQVGDDGTLLIGRQALRDAVGATENYEGLTGTLTCGENGDCADPHIAVNEVRESDEAEVGMDFFPIWDYLPPETE